MEAETVQGRENAADRDVVVRQKDAKSIVSKSKLSDYSVNPYNGCEHACKYCYASGMPGRTPHEEPWGMYVDVKNWPEIRNAAKYAGKGIFVGSVTDPYQPAEAEYGRTRRFLQQMQGSGARIGITTKSDLILRDLDLIASIPDAHVTFSVNTLDEKIRQELDSAAPIERRLAAMKAFHDAGVHTTCFIAPVMPGITGVPSIILAVRDRCGEVFVDGLNLRGPNRQVIYAYIRKHHPDLMQRYIDMYEHGDRRYWDALHRQLTKFAREEGLSYARRGDERILPAGSASGPHITLFTR